MLTLTEAAIAKLETLLAEQPGAAYGLRVTVEPGGCAGYRYGLSLARAAGPQDWVGEFGGVRVLVDPESAPLLQGARVDYVETLQGSGFSIANPRATSTCGCGKSLGATAGAGSPGGREPEERR